MSHYTQLCPGGYDLTQSECNAYRIALGTARGKTVGGGNGAYGSSYPYGCWDNGGPYANVYFNTNANGRSQYSYTKPICKYAYGGSTRVPPGC